MIISYNVYILIMIDNIKKEFSYNKILKLNKYNNNIKLKSIDINNIA